MKVLGAILWYIYCLIIIAFPINAIMGNVSFGLRVLIWMLIYIAYMFFPTIVYTLMHILLLVGIYFVHRDYPMWCFVLYLILLISFFIRTIVITFGARKE